MSGSMCKTSVLRIYQEVIDEVISGARELFLEDGVDEQVLQELKQTWETKLMATKAVQNEQEEKKKQEQIVAATSNGFPKQQPAQQPVQQVKIPQPQQQPQQIPQQHAAPQIQTLENNTVPIQITLPPQPGTDGTSRVLTIRVPATALQGNQLQKVLTGPVITATMGLPANIASSVLQQHVNAAFSSQQQTVAIVNKTVLQTDGAHCLESEDEGPVEIEFILPKKKGQSSKTKSFKRSKKLKLSQIDGPLDTSDDDDDGTDDNDDDDDLDDEKDEDDQEMEDEVGEEEPLNSEDDVSDEDPTDLFDTDNIVVCQYDKIIRHRNKWKFYLKDGIMNLNGLDYVFQKAGGDAEW